VTTEDEITDGEGPGAGGGPTKRFIDMVLSHGHKTVSGVVSWFSGVRIRLDGGSTRMGMVGTRPQKRRR
jgi:hypothetical protein